jgi:hypothetical protein
MGEFRGEYGGEHRRPLGDPEHGRPADQGGGRDAGVAAEPLDEQRDGRPVATPVASHGVSMPPTAPARMNSAVSTGFSTIATVTAISVSPPARLSTMML